MFIRWRDEMLNRIQIQMDLLRDLIEGHAPEQKQLAVVREIEVLLEKARQEQAYNENRDYGYGRR